MRLPLALHPAEIEEPQMALVALTGDIELAVQCLALFSCPFGEKAKLGSLLPALPVLKRTN